MVARLRCAPKAAFHCCRHSRHHRRRLQPVPVADRPPHRPPRLEPEAPSLPAQPRTGLFVRLPHRSRPRDLNRAPAAANALIASSAPCDVETDRHIGGRWPFGRPHRVARRRPNRPRATAGRLPPSSSLHFGPPPQRCRHLGIQRPPTVLIDRWRHGSCSAVRQRQRRGRPNCHSGAIRRSGTRKGEFGRHAGPEALHCVGVAVDQQDVRGRQLCASDPPTKTQLDGGSAGGGGQRRAGDGRVMSAVMPLASAWVADGRFFTAHFTSTVLPPATGTGCPQCSSGVERSAGRLGG